ncbi:MAG TPA: hypothetical protein VEW03_00580, partial [Longimicrobiaceae bacterium]|nr:hypothetical protein [Longimicrobiaceae bacterium]
QPHVHSSPVVLVVSPDSQEIHALRDEFGEDFYVVADDAMWYRASTHQMLDSLRIPYLPVGRGHALFRVRGKTRRFDWSRRGEAWFLVLYNGEDEPSIAADVDLEAALMTFRRGGPAGSRRH